MMKKQTFNIEDHAHRKVRYILDSDDRPIEVVHAVMEAFNPTLQWDLTLWSHFEEAVKASSLSIGEFMAQCQRGAA